MRFVLILALLATQSAAQTCPQAADHSARMDGLLAAVQAAPDENAARLISNDMWALWADAPDEVAQEMLDSGMTRRAGYDFLGAIDDFDRLVAYCPDYAEGYNQRAFVNFIRQDFAVALEDLDKALALSPRHIGAIAGRSMTLIALGRNDEAQVVLRQALALNPWLKERHLLVEPKAKDL